MSELVIENERLTDADCGDEENVGVAVIVLDFEQKNPTQVAVIVIVPVRLALTGLLVSEGDREAETLGVRDVVLDTERLVETDGGGDRGAERLGVRDVVLDTETDREGLRDKESEGVLLLDILCEALLLLDIVTVPDGDLLVDCDDVLLKNSTHSKAFNIVL